MNDNRHQQLTAELRNLRWWLALLLLGNIAVAVVNVAVQVRMACQ